MIPGGIRKPTTVLGWLLRDTALALVCGQIVLFASLVVYFRLDLYERAQRELFHVATFVADEIYAADSSASVGTFREVARRYVELNPDSSVLLLDQDRRVIAAVPDHGGTAPQLDRKAIAHSFSRTMPSLPLLITLPAELGGHTAPFSSATLRSAGGSDRVLVVTFSSHAAELLAEPRGILGFLLVLAPLLLGGAGITFVVTALVGLSQTRNLRAIATTARRYLSGDRSARAPELSKDEIGDLGPAINALADEVQSLERRLAHSELQRRSLLAGLAHDIGTPLTSLTGFLTLLRRSGDREKSDVFLERARGSLERVRGMLAQIAALDRDDLHEIPFHPHRMDLARIINTVVTESALAAKHKQLRLHAELGAADHQLHGDPQLLGRVVQNLVGNALRYTPKGGEVVVTTGERNGMLVVAVRDTGIGIPAEELPRLFEEFVRANESHKENPGGTGLGLAIVKRFVSLHGGDIAIESEVGKGSCFTVVLPRSPGEQLLPLQKEVPAASGNGEWDFHLKLLFGVMLALTPWLLPGRSSPYHPVLGLLIGAIGVALVFSIPQISRRWVFGVTFNIPFWLTVALIPRAELLVTGYLLTVGALLLMGTSFIKSYAISLPTRVSVTFVGSTLLVGTAIYFYSEQHLLGLEEGALYSRLEAQIPQLRRTIESAPSGLSAPRVLLHATRFMPRFNVTALVNEGRTVGQSAIFGAFYKRLGPVDWSMFTPVNGSVPLRRYPFRAYNDLGPGNDSYYFYPVTVRPLRQEGYFAGLSSEDRTVWRKISEKSFCRFLAIHVGITLILASIIGATVYRSLLERLSFGRRLLRREEVEAPDRSVDELDQVITLLADLRRTVMERTAELLASVQGKRALVRAVDHSLSPPLKLVEDVLTNAESGVIAADDPLWDRAERISGTMLQLVRELVEYARVMQQETAPSEEPLDLVELVEDVISRDISVEHSRRVHAPRSVPLIVSDSALLSRAMELTVDASHLRNSLQIEISILDRGSGNGDGPVLRASFPVAGTLPCHPLSGAADDGSDSCTKNDGIESTDPLLAYAALRRALVEAYLEKLGARFSERNGSWVIELDAAP